MDEITCVMKSDFVGLGDGFNFICVADFIQAPLGFHREQSERFHYSLRLHRFYAIIRLRGGRMENTNKTYSNNDIKKISLWSGNGIFLFLLILIMFVLNLNCLPGLFRSDEFFPPEAIYLLMLTCFMVCVLFGIFLMTPDFLRRNKTEDGIAVSANLRMFLLWLPIFICLMIQTVIFIVCTLLSQDFEMSVFVILSVGILLGILAYVWIIICSALLYASKLIRWYTAGLFVLNLAPIIIYTGCYQIYKASTFSPSGWSYPALYLNPFWQSLLIFRGTIPMVIFFVVGLAGIVGVSILVEKRIYCKAKMGVVSSVYKATVIILLSIILGIILSLGFLEKTQTSARFILVFLISSVLTALVMSYFTFRKDKSVFRTSIILSVVVVSALLIACGIPVVARRNAYNLPKPEEISSIKLSISEVGSVTLDKYFEECIDLNEKILKLIDEGRSQKKPTVSNSDALVEKYSEIKIINSSNSIRFEYKLNNGEYVHRRYNDLYGVDVEKYFIELYRSGVFAYALRQINSNRVRMSHYSGNDKVSDCTLSAKQAKTVLSTYCTELKKAPDSAFYEDCMYIEFSEAYEFGPVVIYVPKSFTETLNLVNSHFNSESKN